MEAFDPPPSIRYQRTSRIWLPLTVSLALHALVGLGALIVSSGKSAQAGGPVPVDALALDDQDGTSILDDPSSGRERPGSAARPVPDGGEEPSEAFVSAVGDLPIVSPIPGAPGTSGPAPAGGDRGAEGGAGGRGTGLLRPPATARTVVFVIDRSISMGLSGALAVAKRELLAGLDTLTPDVHFAVILYNRQAEPLHIDGQTGLVLGTEANRQEVARLLDPVRAEGGTDHSAALRRAVGLGADVIFFVTDADEMTVEQVRNVLRLNRGRALIHTVEINNDPGTHDETPLKLLARQSGGTHRVLAIPR